MIHREERGLVSLVTIDRRDRRNAVDRRALEALHAALRASTESRVVVLTGAGGHFCSGADLSGVEDDDFRVELAQVLRDLRDMPAPTLAAVEGAALGAGTQLALACDLRVAAPDARFGVPAARLGLMVDEWTVQRLAMLCGQGPASAMLLAAETISGGEAHTLGLVQRLGDLDAAMAWAEDITALAPLTIAGHKLALNGLEPAVEGRDSVGFEGAFRRAWNSEDLQEGLAAFREGRRPHFHGR